MSCSLRSRKVDWFVHREVGRDRVNLVLGHCDCVSPCCGHEGQLK